MTRSTEQVRSTPLDERRKATVCSCSAGGGGPTIGTSKRYAQYYDRRMDDRILARIASEHPLQSLTPQERQADLLPVTRDPQPKACSVWVRFGPHSMRVEGKVVVWNDVACGIQFSVGDKELRCWVWANAVTPLDRPHSSQEGP